MKGIVITTENKMFVRDFGEPLYKTLGEVVGGFIEHTRPMALVDPYCMIVNEEGLLQGLPENKVGCALYGTPFHGNPIAGTIVIMKGGINDDGEQDIVGLDEIDIDYLQSEYNWLFEAAGVKMTTDPKAVTS